MPENNGTKKRGLVINVSALLKAAKKLVSIPAVRWVLEGIATFTVKKIVKAIRKGIEKRQQRKADKLADKPDDQL